MEKKMSENKLPEYYGKYTTKELLKVWEEMGTKAGTEADEDKIETLGDMLEEYKLGIFAIIPTE